MAETLYRRVNNRRFQAILAAHSPDLFYRWGKSDAIGAQITCIRGLQSLVIAIFGGHSIAPKTINVNAASASP